MILKEIYIVKSNKTEEVLFEGSLKECKKYLCELKKVFNVNINNYTIYEPVGILYKYEGIIER